MILWRSRMRSLQRSLYSFKTCGKWFKNELFGFLVHLFICTTACTSLIPLGTHSLWRVWDSRISISECWPSLGLCYLMWVSWSTRNIFFNLLGELFISARLLFLQFSLVFSSFSSLESIKRLEWEREVLSFSSQWDLMGWFNSFKQSR